MKPGLTSILSFIILAYTIPIAKLTLADSENSSPEQKILNQKRIYEDFKDLSNWEMLSFPRVKKQSNYTITLDTQESVLKTQSKASASAIVLRQPFDVNQYPILHWRWKIENVYEGGNVEQRSGDDYPLRICVLFDFDKKKAGLIDRATFESLKLIYGEYPPQAALHYIWSNKSRKFRINDSPYTDRVQLVVLKSGNKQAGTWQEEQVNIIDDFKLVFGGNPPIKARLAIMNDSDNTGESATSYVDFIELIAKQ